MIDEKGGRREHTWEIAKLLKIKIYFREQLYQSFLEVSTIMREQPSSSLQYDY